MKYFKVFKLSIANELVNLGFKLVKCEINTNNIKLKVFLFEDNEAIREAFNYLR